MGASGAYEQAVSFARRGLRAVSRRMLRAVLRRRGLELVPLGTGGGDPFRLRDYTPEWQTTWEQAEPYTLTSVERVGALITACEHVVRTGVPGAFVECGVWQGGSSIAAALTFQRLGELRDLYLFDTFTGMPQPGEADIDINGVHASAWWSAEKQKAAVAQYGAGEAAVAERMRASGYPESHVHLIAGMVQDTVPHSAPETIAVLRLDTDFYDSTLHELEQLWPRVAPGGILIIDDYGHFDGARRAVEEFFGTGHGRPYLHRVDYSARLVVKPPR